MKIIYNLKLKIQPFDKSQGKNSQKGFTTFSLHERGFTLVELLLYMGIFSILLVILLQLFSTILSTHAESRATSSVNQDGNFILNRLTYDIHNASGIISPSLGNSCNWPSIPSCQLMFSSGVYQVASEGNLTLTAGGKTDSLNSLNTKITNMTFITLGNAAPGSKPSVQIQFTLQSKIKRDAGVWQTQTFQTTVATR